MPTVLEDVLFGPLNLGLTDKRKQQHRALTALQQVGLCRRTRQAGLPII